MGRMVWQIANIVGAAAVTYFTGNPFAGAAVYAAGTATMALALPPSPTEVTGPRLADLMVQTSTYGTPIPFGYGHNRRAGVMIWLKGNKIDETKHSESAGGGKGLGGGGSETTFYTYSATCAFAFCVGPVVRVNKLWGDGKLFYDASAGAGPGTTQSVFIIYSVDQTGGAGVNSFLILETWLEVQDIFASGNTVTVTLSGPIYGEVGGNDGSYTVVDSVVTDDGLRITVAETIPTPSGGGYIGVPGASLGGHEKYPGVVTIYLGAEDQLPDPSMEADLGAGNVPAHRGTCYVKLEGLPLADFANHIPNITAEIWDSESPVAVGTIVHDLCRRAGLEDGEIDTTALVQTVLGFTVSRRVTARASLQVLQDILLFDVVETDDRLLWRPRTSTSVATIPERLLGVRPATDAPAAWTDVRDTQEVELPARVELLYSDPARDYQEAMQYGGRVAAPVPTQFSRQHKAIQAPMVLTADTAKQQAMRLLYDAWAGRYVLAFTTSRRFAQLDPTDVITIEDQGLAYPARLLQSDVALSGLAKWQAQTVDTASVIDPARLLPLMGEAGPAVDDVYTIEALGTPQSLEVRIISDPGLTVLHVVDTSMLHVADDDPGYYMAVIAVNPGWRGAVAQRSTDEGAWAPVAAFPVAATGGWTVSVLGPAPTAATFDRTNTVDIKLVAGGLEAYTRAAVLTGESLAILIGDEIVQWQTATQLTAVTWRLGVLLRGRRGTEWAMDTHVLGETVILLEEGAIRRYKAPASDLGAQRFLKAVSVGKELADAKTEQVIARGLSLMPFAPEHIRGVRSLQVGVGPPSSGVGTPEYFTLQDSAAAPWYYFADTNGQWTVTPSPPGAGFRGITVGTPPAWHQVTDETGAYWWVYPDLGGHLTSDTVRPGGIGLVFGPGNSAGITTLGEDGNTYYRLVTDTNGQPLPLSSTVAPPPPPPPPGSWADLLITWRHRTRRPWESLDGVSGPQSDVDVPPVYTLVIYDGAGVEVRRVDKLTEPQWLYPAAWQAEDFATPPATIDVGIRQENAMVGLGHEGRQLI